MSQRDIPHYDFSIIDTIRAGFELFAKNPGVFIVYLIIGWVVSWFVSHIPFLGAPMGLLVGTLHALGFYVLVHRTHERGGAKIEECLDAVDLFGQASLILLVRSCLIFLGCLALLLPGIYLWVAYSLAMPVLIVEKWKFWEALEQSRRLITRRWFKVVLFWITILVLNLLGFLALGIGILFTVPTSYAALYLLYRDIRRKTLAPAPLEPVVL
ncbi:MAG: hypothetical protein HUU37_00770 [Bdellovibrionales bacterium]|nr:hypothetical protein [Bdellovibrionales bacterium]